MDGFGDVSGMGVLFIVLFFVSIVFIAAMGWKAYRRIFHPGDAQQQDISSWGCPAADCGGAEEHTGVDGSAERPPRGIAVGIL